MFIVERYQLAVILCFITMLCWGSWANTQKLSPANWPFQLFYRDYVMGVLFFSLLWALTLGSFGTEGQSFIVNISQAGIKWILFAFTGGVIFNLANILFVAAIDKVGMAIAFPVAIGISCALGTTINYIAQPAQTNSYFLFAGIALFLLAVLLNALAHKKIQKANNTKSFKGILVAILSGLFMGVFYYSVASSISVTDKIIVPTKLTPYTATVIFAIGVFLSDFVWNSKLLSKMKLWNEIDYSQYFKVKPSWHLVGFAGGIIWCLGMSLSIISAGKAGYAIAFGLGNGATLIATLWGIWVWKEFKSAPKGTSWLLTGMSVLFITAILFIIISKN